MSWDIVLFNLSKKVHFVNEIDDHILIDIGTGLYFKELISSYFSNVQWKGGNWGSIQTPEYSIEFSLGKLEETFTNKLVHLSGEKAIYPVIDLCRKFKWQLFDTGHGEMIDIDCPEKNGYTKFQEYLNTIIIDN